MGFTCCICHEELYYLVKKTDEDKAYERPIVATKCGHLFHNDCLRKWFAAQGAEVWTNRECPVCGMTLTVATDLIRVFSSSADEGGPGLDDLKLIIQKLQSDKKELIKRLELSFLQSRDAQKQFDQYKRDNDRMADQLRKRQSENSKLKTENEELKNVVINLTKSFTGSGSLPQYQPMYRDGERTRPPPLSQNSNYSNHANLPPRFRPLSNANGNHTIRPPSQKEHNYQGMPSNTTPINSGNDESRLFAYSMFQLQKNRGNDFSRMGIEDSMSDMKRFSPPESETASEHGESFEIKTDKEVAAAMGFLNFDSVDRYEITTKSNILNADGDIKEIEDHSNYFPRLTSENTYLDLGDIGSNNNIKNVKMYESDGKDIEDNAQRTASPTNEFLEALLNGNDEVEHVINDGNGNDTEGTDTSDMKNGNTEPTRVDPKTPYQGTKQCYGKYVCGKCNAKWGSSRSWANKPQMCLYCKTFVYPHAQAPLMSKDELEKKIHY